MIEKGNLNIFCEDLDDNVLSQMYSCMVPRWTLKAALMPDAHLGYSMPIGGVALTDQVVVPSWVGYDIGCGVCAIETGYQYSEVVKLQDVVYDRVKEVVPMGFKQKEHVFPYSGLKNLSNEAREIFYDRNGLKQLGTLGGGNHFIEMAHDEEYGVWIVIHSGSRGAGHGIAGHYMRLKGHTPMPHNALDINAAEGSAYLKDMDFMLKYALANRCKMLELIEDGLRGILKTDGYSWKELINKNHNHAEVLNGGQVLHRKGATSARMGEFGIIPGNMRDGSVIVTGLGNDNSLLSCSHGAGRTMSRKEAKRTLHMSAFTKQMSGIKANVVEGTLDEAPGAYKNFKEVMEHQKDLCKVHKVLKPIINWKP